jgi:outer membrane protein TolC
MLSLFASDAVTILKKNKQDIIQYKKQEVEANTQKLKYNWISPLNISSLYTKTDTNDDFISDTSITLKQDIFRFGGIAYQMNYADAKSRYDLATIAIENASLYKELFLGLLTLQTLQLSLEQTQYKLKNSEIEIFLKTQQYKTGNVDITELNTALRDKNTILKVELTLKQNIIDQKISLKKLTDIPLQEIKLPTFKLLSQEEYTNLNYNILQAQLSTQQADQEYKIIKSNYYPSISINGQYGYVDNPNINQSKDYSSIGAAVNFPLDYNTNTTIEESKLAFMRTKVQVYDTVADELSLYEQAISKVKNYQENNVVIKNNIELYNKLIKIIEQGLKVGFKTGYDLQTLQNTRTVDEIEMKINLVNIQIELAQLQFSTNLGENYYDK